MLQTHVPPVRSLPARTAGLMQGVQAFFRFHGVWAPGVRLLRSWSFRAKLMVVLALLALPLLVLTVHLVHDRHEALQRAELRLTGARLADATFALGFPLLNERQLLVAGRAAVSDDRTVRYADLLSAYEQARVAGLLIDEDWEARRPVLERVITTTPVPGDERRVEALSLALQALTELHVSVVQRSTVLLSNDVRSDALAGLAFNHLPRLQVAIARTRAELVRLAAFGVEQPQDLQLLHRALVAVAGELALARAEAVAAEADLNRASSDKFKPSGVGPADPLIKVRGFLDSATLSLSAGASGWSVPALMEQAAAARQDVMNLRLSLSDTMRVQLQADRDDAGDARLWLAIGVALTIVLSLYGVYSLYLVMSGGLQHLEQQMGRMAEGDLSARPLSRGRDEVGRTMAAMSQALAGLSDLLASVREGVTAFRQASQQIATGNQAMSTRNHQMSEGLETLVAGVASYAEQLQACGRQVEAVVGSVQSLRLDAARNRRQMARLGERLQGLRGKSREIGEIVSLIDNIAFRTNILALNASVEASKAGEAGRGFAVVAQEVRSLAMRSAESARRIGDIVTRSTEDIETSGVLAEETQRLMGAADAHVDQIQGAMNDVAALTRSGEARSAEILAGITEMTNSTEQNLPLVKQLAAASGELRTQSERLAAKVGQFRLS